MVGRTESSGETGGDRGRLEDLTAAVSAISREVEVLSRQVADLAGTVEAMSTAAVREDSGMSARPDQPEGREEFRPDHPSLEIVVSPIPEIALVALVETTVRGLSGVRSLYSVKKIDDSVRFEVRADPDADLVAEIKQAMPVPVTVLDSDESSVSLALQWN
jgi:hypothetical protein